MTWQMILQTAVLAGILAAFCVLLKKSAKEVLLTDDSSRLTAAFERMAIRIRRYRRGRHREPGRYQVHRDMMILYPDRQLEQHEEVFYVSKLRNALLIIFMGTLLALFCALSGIADPLISEDGSITREAHGGADKQVSLSVRMKNQESEKTEKDEYDITVRSQLYTEPELRKLADQLKNELPEKIRGTNKSLKHVTEKLVLPTAIEGYPFRISWESSSYAAVDSDGSIYTDELRQGESCQAVLTAIMTYRDGEKFEVEIPVTVEAPEPDAGKQLRNDIRSALQESEQETARSQHFILPSEVDGFDLKWTEKADLTGTAVFFLAAAAAAGIWLAADQKLRREMKERKRQMELDYPGILNRMVLYLGAGMSVRNAFFRLGTDYRDQRKRGGERHYAYDEILLVCRELESGHSEPEAYKNLGLRCGLPHYTKLCTLLIRNLRKGSSALLSVLQEESKEAMMERKNLARELGEKAGTRMLFPMVMMLAVTMIIIIIPAYYGFSV